MTVQERCEMLRALLDDAKEERASEDAIILHWLMTTLPEGFTLRWSTAGHRPNGHYELYRDGEFHLAADEGIGAIEQIDELRFFAILEHKRRLKR